jgi:hypothetical protein
MCISAQSTHTRALVQYFAQSTYIYTQSTTVYIPASELGPPPPLRERVRGWGSPNFNDWRNSLALCLLCGIPPHLWYTVHSTHTCPNIKGLRKWTKETFSLILLSETPPSPHHPLGQCLHSLKKPNAFAASVANVTLYYDIYGFFVYNIHGSAVSQYIIS